MFPYLCVIPVHVEFVSVEDVWTLVDVLDGQADCWHHSTPNFALGRARCHGEKCGKVDISSEIDQQCFYFNHGRRNGGARDVASPPPLLRF